MVELTDLSVIYEFFIKVKLNKGKMGKGGVEEKRLQKMEGWGQGEPHRSIRKVEQVEMVEGTSPGYQVRSRDELQEPQTLPLLCLRRDTGLYKSSFRNRKINGPLKT